MKKTRLQLNSKDIALQEIFKSKINSIYKTSSASKLLRKHIPYQKLKKLRKFSPNLTNEFTLSHYLLLNKIFSIKKFYLFFTKNLSLTKVLIKVLAQAPTKSFNAILKNPAEFCNFYKKMKISIGQLKQYRPRSVELSMKPLEDLQANIIKDPFYTLLALYFLKNLDLPTNILNNPYFPLECNKSTIATFETMLLSNSKNSKDIPENYQMPSKLYYASLSINIIINKSKRILEEFLKKLIPEKISTIEKCNLFIILMKEKNIYYYRALILLALIPDQYIEQILPHLNQLIPTESSAKTLILTEIILMLTKSDIEFFKNFNLFLEFLFEIIADPEDIITGLWSYGYRKIFEALTKAKTLDINLVKKTIKKADPSQEFSFALANKSNDLVAIINLLGNYNLSPKKIKDIFLGFFSPIKTINLKDTKNFVTETLKNFRPIESRLRRIKNNETSLLFPSSNLNFFSQKICDEIKKFIPKKQFQLIS